MTYQAKNRFQSLPFKRNLQRYTVAPQWDKQFTQTISGQGKVKLSTATAPGDVYAELLKTLPPPGGALHVGLKLTHNP
jgi:hypothetical protein